MRISYLAGAALAVCFLPLSTTANASCSTPTCDPNSSITYGSGSYSTGSSVTMNSGSHSQSASTRYSSSSTAPCPAGSTRSEGVCLSSGSTSYSSYSTGSSAMPSTRYSSGASYSSGSTFSSSTFHDIVPFSTSTSNMSNYRIEGMGSNESLAPTSCPTNVYNPEGGKVLGCYSVVKSTPAPRPAPIVVPQTSYQQVRVVRPIVYVRYPVPTPYAVPVYTQQRCNMNYSRYGNAWPRFGRQCG